MTTQQLQINTRAYEIYKELVAAGWPATFETEKVALIKAREEIQSRFQTNS
jgi:hypothetical protein